MIRDPSKFYELVYDHRIQIDLISRVSEPSIRVHYRQKNAFVKEHKSSNIVISLWTVKIDSISCIFLIFKTSAARLILLEFLDQVEKCPGAKSLYTGIIPRFLLIISMIRHG